jgi:hypothetical protein
VIYHSPEIGHGNRLMTIALQNSQITKTWEVFVEIRKSGLGIVIHFRESRNM